MVRNPPANRGDLGSVLRLGRSLEKEMAAHSSILAREMPRTGEPGGLTVHGVTRVQHDLANKPSP